MHRELPTSSTGLHLILLTGLLSDEPRVELEVLETTLSTPVQSSLLPRGRKKDKKKKNTRKGT